MSQRLSPVSKRKFFRRLKFFGVHVVPDRGKGGEIYLRQEETDVVFTLPHLANGEDVKVCYIQEALRRFNIPRRDWLRVK
jgi:hypothetical protein